MEKFVVHHRSFLFLFQTQIETERQENILLSQQKDKETKESIESIREEHLLEIEVISCVDTLCLIKVLINNIIFNLDNLD